MTRSTSSTTELGSQASFNREVQPLDTQSSHALPHGNLTEALVIDAITAAKLEETSRVVDVDTLTVASSVPSPSPAIAPPMSHPLPFLLFFPSPSKKVWGNTVRYDTRCYFNVRSKADISHLNLPHGTDN